MVLYNCHNSILLFNGGIRFAAHAGGNRQLNVLGPSNLFIILLAMALEKQKLAM